MERKLAWTGCGAVLVVVASWGFLWEGQSFFVQPMGGHDGLYCGSTLVLPDGSRPGSEMSIPCGLGMTPLFLGILALMIAGAVAGVAALLRSRLWIARLAASALALAAVLVLVEAWLGRNSPSGTLTATRTVVHAVVPGLAAVALLRFGRTRGLMPVVQAPADS